MTNYNLWDAAARARMNSRWASASIDWNRAMTEALIAATALTPHSVVLDLAAGSGDPALSVAERVVSGKCIAVDSARGGLLLAKTQAKQVGLGSRIACIQGDAHAIPVARNSVDRITCRCGIMYFNDTAQVLAEMLRILKPDGWVALLAWGPFDQPFFQATVGVALKLVPGADMPPEARKMFRFATPGSLDRQLRTAGFSDVREQSVTLPRIWAGTPEELWSYQQEVSTLCHPVFTSIPAALKPELDKKVSSMLARFRNGSVLSVPANVIIATGRKQGA